MKSRALSRFLRKWADALDPSGRKARREAEGAASRTSLLDLESMPLSPRRITSTHFEEQIRGFRDRHKTTMDTLVTGSVQLLGFEEVRERFGDAWVRVRDRAFLIAETCIEKEITDDDLYVRAEDDTYLILFGKASAAEGEAKARRIAAAVTVRLCGEMPETGPLVTVRGLAVTTERSLDLSKVDSVAKLTQVLRRTHEEATERERRMVNALRAELSFAYWPTLNVAKGLVSAYECVLLRRGGGGGVSMAAEMMPLNGTGQFALAVDMDTLRGAIGALKNVGQLKRKALLLVPVHYETLQVRSFRERYRDICRQLPRQSRHRVVLLLRQMPPDVPQSRLREIFFTIQPFFLGFVARLPDDFRAMSRFHGSGLIGVSTHSVIGEPEKMYETLKGFTDAAAKAGYRTFYDEVISDRSLTAALTAGFELINGEPVMRAVDMPGRVYRLKGPLARRLRAGRRAK